MKKTFTPETTAAAELFTQSATPEEVKTDIKADKKKKSKPQQGRPMKTEQKLFVPWKALPDGERRDRRMQITCKPSVLAKAIEIAKAQGVSLNYLFEILVSEKYEEFSKGNKKQK